MAKKGLLIKGKDAMKRNRLLLELEVDDSISFTIPGSDELIGLIKIDKQRHPHKSAHLVIEFISSISVLRANAKNKKPKTKKGA